MTSYFERRDGGYLPGENAAGPWAPDMLHGRFLGGLAARQLEVSYVEPGWRVARLTVDLFRPAALDLVQIQTVVVRTGRRIRVVDAIVSAGGVDVASVRAVVLREGEPPPGDVWMASPWESPAPDSLPLMETQSGGEPVWEFRVHQGGFASADRSRIWTNEHGFLVEDESITPLVRAAISADFASPLSNGGDAGVGYINSDYTLAMARYPVGEWVGLETTTHLASEGIALGSSTMHDLLGPFGTSTTTALANPILGS